jgi:steroid delta-isomerase-like uncharacterized protein
MVAEPGQHELTSPSPLLDARGDVIQVGWARRPLLEANLENTRIYRGPLSAILRPWQRFRVKRWDYYGVTTPTHFFSATLADLGYAGQAFVYLIDFATGRCQEQTITVPLARGIDLPRGSTAGESHFEDGKVRLAFVTGPAGRRVEVNWHGFAGADLAAELFLRQTPEHESTVVLIPIRGHRFYYNHKMNCLPAEGHIRYGGQEIAVRLGDSDLGIKPAEPVVSALSRGDGGSADATFHTELIDYVAEHYEIASYRALARLALRAGDPETARVCNQILRDEIAMVDALDLGQPEAGTVHARETGSPAGQVQGNVQVARDSFDALNEQDLDRYDKFIPDDVRVDSPGVRSPMDRWQQHDYLDGLLGAFPGAHFEITRVIAQGDHVVVDWIASGTQTQPLQSPDGQTFPASDKQVRLPASTTLEVRQGKIRRAWNYWDMGSLIAQISPTHIM